MHIIWNIKIIAICICTLLFYLDKIFLSPTVRGHIQYHNITISIKNVEKVKKAMPGDLCRRDIVGKII